MDLMNNGLALTKNTVNSLFGHREPWQVASITASSLITSIWIWNFLFQDESKLTYLLVTNFSIRLLLSQFHE